MDREKCIAIVSGGMDSVVLLHFLHEGNDVHIVSFDYDQRHVKELEFARWHANNLGLKHTIVPVGFLSNMLHGSALTTKSMDVPEGHYAADSMRDTVVPNRNSIMLNIAAGIAVAEDASFVATGVHAGDHAVYPDCRPQFIQATSTALRLANEGFCDPGFQIIAPFVNIAKETIAVIGEDLDVRFDMTWSCYKGGDKHCGRCGTCVERKEAFRLGGVPDPTEYEDDTYEVEAFRG